MIVHLVTVDWHYETEFHGIFSSTDLAEDYIDGMVGVNAGEAYRIADGSMFQPKYRREDFNIQEFHLDGLVEEKEAKPKICGDKFTTREKQLTYTCSRIEDHDGYHGDGRAVWGFEPPKMNGGCF